MPGDLVQTAAPGSSLSPSSGSTNHQLMVAAASSCVKPLLPLLPGAAHSITFVAIGHPFDTMKTRLQLGMHPTLRQCVAYAYNNGGLLTLYRGATMPLLQLIMKRPFEFYAFEWFNRTFAHIPGSSFAGGAMAGVLSALLGCPFCVVKIQMQATGRETYPNNARAVLAVWRASGVLGFWSGFKASLITKVPFSTAFLGTYGYLREKLPKTAWTPAVSGAAASMVTWSILLPLDTTQTRIQSKALQATDNLGWIGHFRQLVSRGGAGPAIRALWAGWTPVALRALPSSALAMFAYEKTRNWVDTFREELDSSAKA